MKTAILGTGMVGRAMAEKLRQIGHEVIIGTRNVDATLANTEKDAYGNAPFKLWHQAHSDIELDTFEKAAAATELIFNCTSGQASLAALKLAGVDQLAGKVLIDLANPLDFSNGMPPSLNPVNTDSLGEQIQREFPKTKVVKTLNTMNVAIMVDPTRIPGDHNVFICGNDEGAKQQTMQVLHSFGWTPQQIIDLGDISNARGTEMMLPIWLRVWQSLGSAEFNFQIAKA